MPFNIGESINSVGDAFLRAPFVEKVARNPIYTSLIITFIIVLMVMFVFRDAETDESLLTLGMRSGFWIFLMLTGALFLHNKVLMTEQFSSEKNAAYDGVFEEYPERSFESGVVPVVIPAASAESGTSLNF